MSKARGTTEWGVVILCFFGAFIYLGLILFGGLDTNTKLADTGLVIALVALASTTYGFMEVNKKLDKINNEH